MKKLTLFFIILLKNFIKKFVQTFAIWINH